MAHPTPRAASPAPDSPTEGPARRSGPSVLVYPLTRLDGPAQPWPVDDVVDNFLAAGHRPALDVSRHLQWFVTDPTGPIAGFCDLADLRTLETAVANRLAAAGTARL